MVYSRPLSDVYAAEDREATDAGLKRTAAGRDDDSTDNHHEQRRPDEVASLAGDERRDRAPSMGRAEQVKVDDWGASSGSYVSPEWRMFGAKAPASPASATKDALGSINFRGEVRR